MSIIHTIYIYFFFLKIYTSSFGVAYTSKSFIYTFVCMCSLLGVGLGTEAGICICNLKLLQTCLNCQTFVRRAYKILTSREKNNKFLITWSYRIYVRIRCLYLGTGYVRYIHYLGLQTYTFYANKTLHTKLKYRIKKTYLNSILGWTEFFFFWKSACGGVYNSCVITSKRCVKNFSLQT